MGYRGASSIGSHRRPSRARFKSKLEGLCELPPLLLELVKYSSTWKKRE